MQGSEDSAEEWNLQGMNVSVSVNGFEKAAFVNSDSQLYKQAGNGVTVDVVQAIAEKLKESETE